ncbi:MAG: acireductone synthase [Alphaproteobacteria bacterium]|nr:MAG: acireductone synthase [Alphaproteobacteria bacterium]
MNQEIKAIVTDIEGTTSSLSFVKDTLFPYAYKNMPDFVLDNEDEIAALINDVREVERNPDLSIEEVIEVLLRYIDEDQKITPLKTLQGMIWEEGYKAGELVGHIYDDALVGLKRWKDQGIDLYIYSSGSVPAQKMLFGHTNVGDINALFSGYFDTTTGGKKDLESYIKIAAEIGLPAQEILFLSDCVEEIASAAAAGMNVVILDRDGTSIDALGHNIVQDFDDILKEMADA